MIVTSVAIQAWQTAGLGGLSRATLGLGTGLLITVAALWLLSRPFAASLAFSAAALAALHNAVGGAHPWVDLAYVVASAVVAGGIVVLRTRRKVHMPMSRGVGLFWGLLWCFVSIGDRFMESMPLRAPGVPDTPHRNASPWPKARVGIALSGGGYRAALYHAGVVDRLDAWGVPIESMSTVSGGSIFGSFYATGGTPRIFLDSVRARRFNVKRAALSLPSIGRMVLSSRVPFTDFTLLPIGDYGRTTIQAAMLDRLFLAGTRLEHTISPADDAMDPQLVPWRPELMVCATDVVHNLIVGFTPRAVLEVPIEGVLARFDSVVAMPRPPAASWFRHPELEPSIPLSELVTASGAFPVAFNPVHVSVKLQDKSRADYVLADGGIADNLGLVPFFAAREKAAFAAWDGDGPGPGPTDGSFARFDVRTLIASDASAISSTTLPKSWLSAASNAIDVVYRATGGAQLAGDSEFRFPPTVIVTPAAIIPAPDLTSRRGPATQHESVVSLPFGRPLGEVAIPTCGGIDPNRHYRALSYWYLSADALEIFVDAARDAGDAEAAAATASLARVRERYALLQGDALKSADARFAGRTLDDERVYAILVRELGRCARRFLDTSTLEDQMPPELALDLFHLGEYMALLNEPFIRARLEADHDEPPL